MCLSHAMINCFCFSCGRFFFPANILSHMDELDEPIENENEFTAIMMVHTTHSTISYHGNTTMLTYRHLDNRFYNQTSPYLRRTLNIWSHSTPSINCILRYVSHETCT